VVWISDRPDEAAVPPDPEPAVGRRETPSDQQIRDEICREILQIHEEAYGKGTGQITAIVDGDWVIVVLDLVELPPYEQFLLEAGHQDTVIDVRHRYQLAIQASFRAAVERATGRTVVGFASTSDMDEPRFAAEIFKLD
jgi:uncharacterized protein YbcI